MPTTTTVPSSDLTRITLSVLGIGFLIAGFIPPPSPHQDPAAVAKLINDDHDRIRIGLRVALARIR